MRSLHFEDSVLKRYNLDPGIGKAIYVVPKYNSKRFLIRRCYEIGSSAVKSITTDTMKTGIGVLFFVALHPAEY